MIRVFIQRIILFSILVFPVLGMAQPARFIEGRDYTLIQDASQDDTPDIVEVVEFFWYGCPGCYQLDPAYEDWSSKQPDKVVCSRLPAVWSELHEQHAKIFYTADILNVLEDLHHKVFTAIHVEGKAFRDFDAIESLFASVGIPEDEFERTFSSFTINTRVNRAKSMAVEYELRSTPSIIINNRYVIGPSNDMLEIAGFLINKELSAIQALI